MVRDLCPIHDLPAQILVHDQQRNPGVHHIAKHCAGIHIPESHHVRRYRQRTDVGKHHGDGVAGRQDVHRGHNADVGVRLGPVPVDRRIPGNSFPAQQRFPPSVVLPDTGESHPAIFILFRLIFRRIRSLFRSHTIQYNIIMMIVDIFFYVTAVVLVREKSQPQTNRRKIWHTYPIAQQEFHARKVRRQQAVRGYATESNNRFAGPQRRRKIHHHVHVDRTDKSNVWYGADRGLRY